MHPFQPWCAPRPLPSGYSGGDARTGRAQMAAMAPVAFGLSSMGLGSYPATPCWGAIVFVCLFLGTLCTGTESGAPGAAEGWERTNKGDVWSSTPSRRQEGWGRGKRRDQDLPISGVSGDSLCAGVRGIPLRVVAALPRPCSEIAGSETRGL